MKAATTYSIPGTGKPRTYVGIAVLFLLFFLVLGCTCVKFMPNHNPHPGVNSKSNRAPGWVQLLDKPELLAFPGSYRMVHRVRLTIRKRSYDFIGYLAVNGCCWRAIALSEMGGKVFDLVQCRGKQTVFKRPHLFPAGPLKSVLTELGYIFAQPGLIKQEETPYQERENGKNKKNAVKLFIEKKPNHPDASIAGASNCASPAYRDPGAGSPEIGNEQPPADLLLVRGNCLLAEIYITDFRLSEGWPLPVPSRILVKNLQWGYVLQAEMIRMEIRPVGSDVFKRR